MTKEIFGVPQPESNPSTTTELTFRSFENAKQHLQEFSKKTQTDCYFTKVATSAGLFDIFDYKVTGDDLNKALSEVQDYLIGINTINRDLINEFGQVYTALESLDKEYIPAIMGAIKAAETASDQAMSAQKDISETIKKIKAIVEVLAEHHDKLKKLEHLEHVDDIWKELKDVNQELQTFQIASINHITDLTENLHTLQSSVNTILEYNHLENIDEIWEMANAHATTIKEHSSRIEFLKECVETSNSSIASINLLIDRWENFEHLEEIDCIWQDLEKFKNSHSQLDEKIDCFITKHSDDHNSIEQQIKDLLEDSDSKEKLLNTLQEELAEEQKTREEITQKLNKKLQLAYIFTAGAVSFSIIQLILIIVGVI